MSIERRTMQENYLNNLILTEYIHDVQILEEPYENIPEAKIKVKSEPDKSTTNNSRKSFKKNKKEQVLKESELINLDIDEKREMSEQEIAENEKLVKNIATEVNKKLLEFDYIKKQIKKKPQAKKKQEKHIFNEWLDLLNIDNYNSYSFENELSDKKNADIKSNHLIDEFLNTNPKRPSEVSENTDTQDLSEESVKETTELLTETLAKIYIRQKAYLKAISAYEKLSLKYPEKSTYFADQIEKIKIISNN